MSREWNRVVSLTRADGVELRYWLAEPADRSEPGQPAGDGGPEVAKPVVARPAVLLLHGAASNHTRWSEFAERTRLRRDRTLIAPDLRGNGESMTRSGQTLAAWSRDQLAVLDREGLDRVPVVGHSLGAQIAMRIAHEAPMRVAGLVLLDPVFRRALRGKYRRLRRLRWLVGIAAATIAGLNHLGLYRRTIPNRDIRALDEATRADLAGGETVAGIAKRYGALGPILRHTPVANYLRQVLAVVSEPPPLETIRCPVLVLLSGSSTMADAAVTREEIRRFAAAEVVTLGANHWPLTEAPDETRLAIEEWTERIFPLPSAGASG